MSLSSAVGGTLPVQTIQMPIPEFSLPIGFPHYGGKISNVAPQLYPMMPQPMQIPQINHMNSLMNPFNNFMENPWMCYFMMQNGFNSMENPQMYISLEAGDKN